jgi:sulfite exporter TauE/SafE
LAQLSDIYTTDTYLVPWIAFLVGIGGSLHCIGMCGGLATGCTVKKNGNILYQLGRLASYTLLGLFAGTMGRFLMFKQDSVYSTLIPAIMIGLIFIYWGLKPWLPNVQIHMPKKFSDFHMRLWRKYLGVEYKDSNIAPFMIGSLSIFLPCGLLYGVVLALASFKSPMIGAISMLAFGLGTLPAMGLAPSIIQKILTPLRRNMPLVSSFVLVSFGVITISTRLYTYYTTGQCH